MAEPFNKMPGDLLATTNDVCARKGGWTTVHGDWLRKAENAALVRQFMDEQIVARTVVDSSERAAAATKDPATSALRIDFARELFGRGYGKAIKITSLEEYLAGIPEIPEVLLPSDERFPHLVLVDSRPGITKMCKMAKLRYGGNDNTFVPYDEERAIKDPVYWIRANHGWQNRNRCPSDCRRLFVEAGNEVGLEAREGVALYTLIPDVRTMVKEGRHCMDLPGSVNAEIHDDLACLGYWNGEPRLHWYWRVNASSGYGSASRRDCPNLKP